MKANRENPSWWLKPAGETCLGLPGKPGEDPTWKAVADVRFVVSQADVTSLTIVARM